MQSITLSKQAKEDLLAIWSYIAEESPAAADRVLDALNEKFGMLAAHPNLGPARPDIAPGLRYLVSDNYLVVYQVHKDSVDVVRVLHGARDLMSVLSEDEAA